MADERLAGAAMHMTGKVSGEPGFEPSAGLLFAALPGEEDVCHGERNVQKSANTVEHDKAEHENPQDKQDRRDVQRQQSDQHADQYFSPSSKVLAQTPRSVAPNVAPYGAFAARRTFLAHSFDFQASTFKHAQPQQQLILETFADHSARAALSVNDNT
ncbi:putative component of type VI protein secretion system [Shinella sp. BE166]|uniref:hypothetical protein n=1 Tax=Shinella sp. BE166 TaxID=3373918 RepID=UPI003EB88710